jgi:LysM repeat protein
MVRKSVMITGLLVVSLGMSGCLVRTYELTQRRADQNLETGNRGFLMGAAPAPAERKLTRTTQVVEFEMGRPMQFERRQKMVEQEATEPTKTAEEMDTSYVQEEPVVKESSADYETYQVQKGDTLQKISTKYFGTTTKWYKIYEANKATMKGPNKIYPGQTIRIPPLGGDAPVKPRKLK